MTLPFTTTVAAAEDGLLAQIIARRALPGSPLAASGTREAVPVRMGDPGGALLSEHVWLGEMVETEERWDTTGDGLNQQREETFDLRVLAAVTWNGDDYDALRARANAIAEELELALMDDQSLGGAVWDSWVRGVRRDSGATDESRGMLYTLTIACRVILGPEV